MAASLGSLVVSLGLNAAEFTAGLSKAEFEAQKATQRLKKDIDAIGTAFGIAAVAAGAFALKLGRDFINAAADLDDMAEKTGASVEELSKLSQQAHISGVALETVETSLIQLSKHLQGSGEESKNTTRALAALGLKADDLKMLDTAEALRVVAVELNKFADGSGKSALAMDLLGKAGAQALPFLKDMANDAALAANVTKEQAAQAEELGKAWRRLTLDAKNVGQALAMDIIPYLKDLIEQFKVGISIAGGFSEALRLFGLSTITKSNAGDKIKEINAELERLNGILSNPPRGAGTSMLARVAKDAEDLKKQLEFAKLLQRQMIDARAGGDTPGEAQRFGLAGARRTLNYEAASAVATAKRTSDAQKLMTLEELLAKAELKRMEQYAETEREMSRVAEQERESRRRTHEKELNDSLAIAQRIQRADVEAHQYLQKEVATFEVAPIYLDGLKDKIDDVSDASRDMGHAIGTAFEDAIIEARSFKDILQGLLQDIARIALRMTVTKPLESAVGGLMESVFRGFFGGSTAGMAARYPNSGASEGALLGSFATGTEYVPKTGPYLLHQGEQVTPANKTASEPIVYSPVYNFNGNAPNRSEVMQMINVGNAQTMRAIPDLMRRGGNFSRTVRGR